MGIDPCNEDPGCEGENLRFRNSSDAEKNNYIKFSCSNEAFSKNCKRTCNVGTCQKPVVDCTDKYDTEKNPNEKKCSVWAEQGQCKLNSGWMIPNCRKSCMHKTDVFGTGCPPR